MEKFDKIIKAVLSELGKISEITQTEENDGSSMTTLYDHRFVKIAVGYAWKGDSFGLIDVYYPKIPTLNLLNSILSKEDFEVLVVRLLKYLLPYLNETFNTEKVKRLSLNLTTETKIVILVDYE
jgi:hypothetical protein